MALDTDANDLKGIKTVFKCIKSKKKQIHQINTSKKKNMQTNRWFVILSFSYTFSKPF